MIHYTRQDIENEEKIKRLNIINSISGIKPGNLIGTKSAETGPNVAVFSSVVHLGSNPAILGFILRPTGEVPRNTYGNILETGQFTINHIHKSITQKAHYTSAKFDENVSEFEACKLTEEYLFGFEAPFVKECAIKMGMKYLETIPIPINGTQMVIGQIEHLVLPEESLTAEGYVNLEVAESIGIGGLNGYYTFNKMAEYAFARPEELPEFH